MLAAHCAVYEYAFPPACYGAPLQQGGGGFPVPQAMPVPCPAPMCMRAPGGFGGGLAKMAAAPVMAMAAAPMPLVASAAAPGGPIGFKTGALRGGSYLCSLHCLVDWCSMLWPHALSLLSLGLCMASVYASSYCRLAFLPRQDPALVLLLVLLHSLLLPPAAFLLFQVVLKMFATIVRM